MRQLFFVLIALLLSGTGAAHGAGLVRFSPQGKTQTVHQVTARFSEPMAALGEPDAAAPFTADCPYPGRGQWLGQSTWTYEFERALPPGARCTFRMRSGLRTLAGTVLAPSPERVVETSGLKAHLLDPHTPLREDGAIAVGFNAPVDVDAALAAMRCQVGGTTTVVRRAAPERAAEVERGWSVRGFIDAWQREHGAAGRAPYVILQCAETLPPGRTGALLVPALRSADGVQAERAQKLEFRTEAPFEFGVGCNRSAGGPCHPRQDIVLHFTESLRREDAAAVRLEWPDGRLAKPDFSPDYTRHLRFAGVFPQHATLKVHLPAGLRDVRGRPYTGNPERSLIKTGVLVGDWMAPRAVAVLPAGAAPQLAVAVPEHLAAQPHRARLLRIDRLGDQALFDWVERLRASLAVPAAQRQPLIAAHPAARAVSLPPASTDPEHRTALPLPGKGLYIVEWPGGASAPDGKPLPWVQTAVLVTDLALHVRQARESSVLWVTSISTGEPVAGARISVLGKDGAVWTARTDRDGLARIPSSAHDGQLRVVVRSAGDMAFAPAAVHLTRADLRAHLDSDRDSSYLVSTVFDSMLVQPGATVHMKHLRRRATGDGLMLPEDAPAQVRLQHRGAGRSFDHTIEWVNGQAAQDWQAPDDAPLGAYTVSIDGQRSGSFRLEAVSAARSSASVEAPARIVAGEPVPPAVLSVTDLNGGPARGAVSMRSTLTEGSSAFFTAFQHLQFGNGEPEPAAPGGQSIAGEVVRKDLDRQGSASFALPLPAQGERVRRLTMEFAFPDANGGTRSVRHSVEVLPTRLLLAVRAGPNVVRGAALAVGATIIDSSGKPGAGHTVHLSIRENAVEAPLCRGITDASGEINCTLAAVPQGRFDLVARSREAAGGAIAAHLTHYPGAPPSGEAVLQLSAPAQVLPSGSNARIALRHGFSAGWMLTTVEREGILDARVRRLVGAAGHLTVPLPAAYAPNVNVHVIQTRADAPKFASASTQIRVAPNAQTLEVKVQADRSTYRPGEQMTVSVAVSAAGGAAPGPEAEVALAVVDAGLLALWENTSWDLLGSMMRTRWPRVRELGNTSNLIRAGEQLVDYVYAADVGMMASAPVSLSANRNVAQHEVRAHFRPQVFWRASVKLDRHGRASIPLRLNDALTRFRIVAVAQAGADRFGHGSTEVVTRQQLELRSLLPPMARAGDRLEARFAVRNRSAHAVDSLVDATLLHPDGSRSALPARRVRVAAGDVRELSWQVDLPAHLRGTLAWSASAQAGQERDQLRVEQTVTAPERPRTLQAALIQLDKPVQLPVSLPPGAVDGALTVNLSERLDGGLAGVRRYFEQYPYTCLEQRMSRAVALNDRAGWNAISADLHRHLDTQRQLLRFFPGEGATGSDTLSAQVLQLAALTGWPVPADIDARLLEGLGKHASGTDVGSTRDRGLRRLSVLAVLALRGKASDAAADSIEPLLDDWPTASIVDWLTLLRHTRHPRRDQLVQEASSQLRARLYTQGTALALSGEQRELRPWMMGHADVSMARLLVAVRDLPEWRAELPALMRGLMNRQRDGHWGTTLANAWGALAMRQLGDQVEHGKVDGTTSIAVDVDKRLQRWEAAPAAQRFDLAAADSVLTFAHAGAGAPWASVAVTATVPLAAAQFNGIRIRKTVVPVEQQVPGRWSRGDVARMQLDLEARTDSNWVVVDDPIPPGATVIGSGLGGDSRLLAAKAGHAGLTPTWQERGRDAVRSYYEIVPRGSWKLEYIVRLDAAGQFNLPATHAEAMYQPEMAGDLPNPTWMVGPAL